MADAATNTTSRRALMKAAPFVAAAAIIPGAAAIAAPPADADAAILAAWERRQAAYVRYQVIPFADDESDPYSVEEKALWAIIDEAEEVIRSTVARTPKGVEIQLWVALYHSVSGREDDEAITRGDLGRLVELEPTFDWNARLAFAALRSLHAMGAA